ncbi:MAG: hypothetical protein ABIR71_08535 [Chthoniobacterales bacterium]
MKPPLAARGTAAFTIAELMTGMAISTVVLAVAFSAAVALQRSFSAVDNYSVNHMHQIRIVDFLARDVRRAVAVTSSSSNQTVEVRIPKYLTASGIPQDPTRVSSSPPEVKYGTASPSIVQYAVAGNSITRTQDGQLTTIASSTNTIVPNSFNTALGNTVATTTEVKFKPISVADSGGTVVYSTSYLRNRRRTF